MRRVNILSVFIIIIITMFIDSSLNAQIIIKQRKDGTILITNYKAGFVSKKRVSKNTKTTNTIPAHIYNKIAYFSKKHGVKKDLILAVAKVESGYNRFAKSKKGAVGIMQLMPDTATKYGVFNRYNIDENIEAGIKHLKYLYGKFNRELVLALAAYNAGENAVIKYSGVPPYKETKRYIKKIFKLLNKPLIGYGFTARKTSKLYKYRTKDGRIMITDRYPSNIKKKFVSVIN